MANGTVKTVKKHRIRLELTQYETEVLYDLLYSHVGGPSVALAAIKDACFDVLRQSGHTGDMPTRLKNNNRKFETPNSFNDYVYGNNPWTRKPPTVRYERPYAVVEEINPR